MTSRILDVGLLQQVSADPSGDRWTLTFTRTFPQPADAMWSALTDPGELPQWAPYTADRDLGSIGPATLIMLDRQERLEVDGTVTIADVSAVLEHAWGDDRLRWELVPCVNGTELTLRHTLDEPQQLPSVAAGWHICLVVADQLLAGTPFGPVVGSDANAHGWQRLHDEYQQILGQR